MVKVCHASLEDIKKNAVSVLEPHFHTDGLVVHKVHTFVSYVLSRIMFPLYVLLFVQFAVSYKARNNKDVNRDAIIKLLANMVNREGDFAHTVDLNNPDLTIVVEIIKVLFLRLVVVSLKCI